jgi:hypothetical protein
MAPNLLLSGLLIETRYNRLKERGAELDIGEHLETLMLAASNAKSILELGVRGAVSTSAFAEGLKRYRLSHLDEPKPVLVSVDLVRDPHFDILKNIYEEYIDFHFFEGDCLTYPISDNTHISSDQKFDIIFIDTFHVCEQMERELKYFADYAKTMIFHDTNGDWERGEVLREHWAWNIDKLIEQGYTREGVTKGLRYAIEPFLDLHKDIWFIKARYENNNGLMILGRV